jgi:hypothetical protein
MEEAPCEKVRRRDTLICLKHRFAEDDHTKRR